MAVVVPIRHDFTVEVRVMRAGAAGHVVVEQRCPVVTLQQEQSPLTGRKAEGMHPEVGEVIHMPRIGYEEPLDLGGDSLPQSAATRRATLFRQHEASS